MDGVPLCVPQVSFSCDFALSKGRGGRKRNRRGNDQLVLDKVVDERVDSSPVCTALSLHTGECCFAAMVGQDTKRLTTNALGAP